MKRICILGSTGSIGKSFLRVISEHRDRFCPIILTARNSGELLLQQAREFSPKICVLTDEQTAITYAGKFSQLGIELLTGEEALLEVVKINWVDTVVSALDGFSGFLPMYEAAKAGKEILFANKEAFVSGSHVIMQELRKNKNRIIPVDSEHSAIYQCLQAGRKEDLLKVVLTASGGPFFRLSIEDLRSVTKEQALAHPTWKMGASVTVNSATLFNKALEVLEAKALFDIPLENIEVVIHPQSVVHGLVYFRDGSVLAQMSKPDMAIPIQYALTTPERLEGIVEPVDLTQIATLEFFALDQERHPALQLAYEAGRGEWWEPCALCAINEALVTDFLADRISFYELFTALPVLFRRRYEVMREAFGDEKPVPSPEATIKINAVFTEFGRKK